MKPIFNRRGEPIAWFEGQFAFDLNGRQLNLYKDYESILSLDGRYLGFYSTGFFRDPVGCPVVFLKGATVGPELPVLREPPLPPPLQIPIFPMLTFLPPYPAIARFKWSKFDWHQYLNP